MGKFKSKGKKSSNTPKKDSNKKTLNPFEIHINRQKHNVIGRKLKADKGLPGVSRSKAMRKRKATILQEYKVKDKTNKFLDRRIGEKNSAMTTEDRIIARFTAERMKRHNKKSIFNLGDDEVLTHHGQTLNEIEKFDDPYSDDEDEEERGKLEADFVEDAHFGGGVLKKVDSNDKKSRKDLIEQLIAESKIRKAEKQKAREQTLELTEKLDSEWKDLLPIVSKSKKKPEDDKDLNRPDSYDTVMRQLKFEARGKPSDPLKSEEELAKAENERLEKFRAEREERMHGFSDELMHSSKHRSADDLDDGFAIESDSEVAVSYDAEGRLQAQGLEEEKEGAVKKMEQDENENSMKEDSEEESNEEEESSTEDLNESGGEGDSKGEEEEGDEEEEEGSTEDLNESGGEGDSKGEEEEEDNLSDLREITESECEPEAPDIKTVHNTENKEDRVQCVKKHEAMEVGTAEVTSLDEKKKKSFIEKASIKFPHLSKVPNTENKEDRVQNHEAMEVGTAEVTSLDEKKKKSFIEKATIKFPHLSKVPDKYEDFQATLESYKPKYQSVIVEHIMKSNQPNLSKGNKTKLETLFAYLLQYLHDAPTPLEQSRCRRHCFVLLKYLAPHLYDLAQMSQKNAWQCVIEVLKEKQLCFRKHSRTYPGLDTLVFLKVISLLFPTSDFRHPVVTPALVFMCQMLLQCMVLKKRDIATGLFLVALVLEYTELSKRFSPAAINFLHGVINSAIPKSTIPTILPFKKRGEIAKLLVLTNDVEKVELSRPLSLYDLTNEVPIDDNFRICALNTAVKMLSEFQQNLESLPANYEIFKPISTLLSELELNDRYPKELKNNVINLTNAINKLSEKKIQLLVIEKKRPKALRLYEPNIEKIFDCKRRRPMGKEKQEREKLLHKYKREEKSALREIRRDNSFIAKLKWKDTVRSDMERNQKVKEIFGSAAAQQGDLRKLKRKK